MACNQNRLNCTPDQIMAATAVKQCSIFGDTSVMQAEQLVFDRSYQELINNFGIEVDYYVNTFNLSGADLLYGEHPTAIFYGPVTMMMYVELSEDALQLSKFGYDPNDEFTGYVSIRSFSLDISGSDFYVLDNNDGILTFSNGNRFLGIDEKVLNSYFVNGQSIEPKSGDLIDLTSLGCDRPNGRGSKIFEIAERVEQDIDGSLNPLLGHYVYRLRAKRYDYSFEPNAPRERVNEQVFENSFSGVLSTNISDTYYSDSISDNKSYPGDIDNESQDIFNMDVNNNDIYGDYY